MDMHQTGKVPVSDADRERPCFKYYDRPPVPLAPEIAGKVFGPPVPPKGALPFTERAAILAPGGGEAETGYCVFPDGTGYVSLVTEIPGGTPEMIDWYIVWRGLEDLRYVIVDPSANLSARTMQTCYALDEDRTMQEKYWDTTQVIKHMGPMGPSTDYLNFKCPSDVGFDMSKIGPERETKDLICARNYAEGEPPAAAPDYFVCHQVLAAEGGVRVVTRAWYGWTTRYGRNEKALPDGFFMQPMVPQALLMKEAAEWANLAAILPSLYAEEHDRL